MTCSTTMPPPPEPPLRVDDATVADPRHRRRGPARRPAPSLTWSPRRRTPTRRQPPRSTRRARYHRRARAGPAQPAAVRRHPRRHHPRPQRAAATRCSTRCSPRPRTRSPRSLIVGRGVRAGAQAGRGPAQARGRGERPQRREDDPAEGPPRLRRWTRPSASASGSPTPPCGRCSTRWARTCGPCPARSPSSATRPAPAGTHARRWTRTTSPACSAVRPRRAASPCRTPSSPGTRRRRCPCCGRPSRPGSIRSRSSASSRAASATSPGSSARRPAGRSVPRAELARRLGMPDWKLDKVQSSARQWSDAALSAGAAGGGARPMPGSRARRRTRSIVVERLVLEATSARNGRAALAAGGVRR